MNLTAEDVHPEDTILERKCWIWTDAIPFLADEEDADSARAAGVDYSLCKSELPVPVVLNRTLSS